MRTGLTTLRGILTSSQQKQLLPFLQLPTVSLSRLGGSGTSVCPETSALGDVVKRADTGQLASG